MDNVKQYELLAELERSSTNTRLTTFTAILTVSFALVGLSVEKTASSVSFFRTSLSLSQIGFLFGFLFYLFGVFHYAWYHRYTHAYRAELKRLEKNLEIEIYRLRKRPRLGRMKLHFDRALWAIAVVYGVIVGQYVGWGLLITVLAVLIVLYFMLLVPTIWQKEEPLETVRSEVEGQDRGTESC